MNAWRPWGACCALLCTLGLVSAVALAHEGEHGGAAPEAMTPPPPPPTTGTHDARTYFTDTRLLDQDGRSLRFYSDVLKDQVVLLNVVFTHCNDACPLITRKLREVREALGPEQADKVLFVSLTSDPVNDTPEVLKAFTQKHGVAGQRWLFLTGTPQDMALVLGRLGHLVQSPEQHSTLLIAGDVANKRWSKIRPDAPANAIAQRLQLLAMPLAGR